MSEVPSSSTRRGVWIAVGAVVVCVAVVTALAVVRERTDDAAGSEVRGTLVLPEEAAGYVLVRSGPARRYARTAQRDLGAQAPGAGVVVGTYARDDEQLVYVGFSFPAASDQGAALARSVPDALRDYLDSAGVEDLEDYDAGPLGGALACGRLPAGAGTQVTCGWADDAVVGSLRFAVGPLADGALADAAALTVEFRSAAESRG